ncbi:MAG TPA: hypothetical protein VJ276_10450 [Thermoanaerobaculia bacterium]|nr:hypothetical protein [Thermoanaerobaculia bacterium]
MSDTDFEPLLQSAARKRKYSPSLRPLLRDVHQRLVDRPPDLPALKQALESLLTYLATPEGRTDANCCTTDYFFSQLQPDSLHLPDDFREVLDHLGGALHDTVYAPHIARNFDSLPEQLLERVRRIVI